MSDLSFCLQAAALHDEDSSALTDAIERYTRAGMPMRRAQLAAIADVVADVRAEREQIHAAVREQHPGVLEAAEKAAQEAKAPAVQPEPAKPEPALASRGAGALLHGSRLPGVLDAVHNLTRGWERATNVHVIESMDDAPPEARRDFEAQQSQGAVGRVDGFHRRGQVYLVANELHTQADVQRVLYHESLGHFGLRGVFGKSLDAVLDATAASMPKDLQRKAQEYGLDLADPAQRRTAAEELLAEIAQDRPELGVVQRAVAAIRTFLREHGIDSLKMSRDEIIREFILPARGFVERGVQPADADGVQFHRAFHGTPHEFDRFSTEHIGEGEGAQAYGWGMYFAENEKVADNYRRQLSGGALVDGKKPNEMTMGPMQGFILSMFRNRKGAGLSDDAAREQTLDWANKHSQIKQILGPDKAAEFVSRLSTKPGNLYQVHVPDDVVSRMLLWDKPLREQPEAVRVALDRLAAGMARKDPENHFSQAVRDGLKGEVIYRYLSSELAPSREEPNPAGVPKGWGGFTQTMNDEVVNDHAASVQLHALGVPGIRYMDAGSRNRSLREIKKEFLDQLPENADFEEVNDLVGTGHFSPENEAILKALKADDWLGFDYPAQAISAALGGHLANYDASPALLKAVADAQSDATHNLVVFHDSNVRITHKDGSPVTRAEREEAVGASQQKGSDPDLTQFSRGGEEGDVKVKPLGDRWVAYRKNPRGGEDHLGYFDTESQARDAAAELETSGRTVAARSPGNLTRWWVESPTQPIQSTSLGRLSGVDRQRAVQETLAARSTSIRSRDEADGLTQIPDRAGWCFPTAAQASAAGLGDMVIGAAHAPDGSPVWHAVVMRDGMVYDPTFGRWFAPAVYESLGFRPARTLTSEQVQRFISGTRGLAPDAKNQGLGEVPPDNLRAADGGRPDAGESPEPPSDDIRFSRRGTTAATAGMPATAPTSTWERAKSVVSDLIDEGLSRSGIYRATAPMSEGSVRARAVAQNFANAERLARAQWNRIAEILQQRFTPEERRQMWEAADEQNTTLQQGQPTAGRGLDRLTPGQRDVVEQLHTYGEELLRRAKNAGMFEGEGLPYWTPRMMVMIDGNGEYARPGPEPGKKQTSGGDGRNVFTSSSNLKQRKYLTAAETEAAMQAKGGELVRDIMTMPLAMQRLERAIAGRELINQIKDLGRATGQPTVATGRPDHEGWFTLDHTAFTTFQPRFEKDEATGKMHVLLDEKGNPVFDRVPLYMSKEFEGPVKAILSNNDGALYRAYMLLKSKAMSALMFSPLIHNLVIFGRALGYDPTMAGTVGLYFRGHAARQDNELLRTAIEGGMVPMGYHRQGMQDITDIARGFGKEGGWLDPQESWIAHGAKAIVGAVNKDAGAAAKRFIDKAGDFWHGTLLWDRVADLQMGIFDHAYQRLQAKGFEPGVAKVMAAHWANRYAGAIARENMGEYARKAANVLLFSRSFNMGNLGTVKDLAYGMPSGMRAKIEAEYGRAGASKAFTEARRKAWAGFIADAAMSLIALSVAQSAVDRLRKDKSWDEIFGGYVDRARAMWQNIKDHPVNPRSYSPWQLSPTHDNEPGKQDRVDMGQLPDAGGRHEYMRLPTGKVVEDLFNWTTHFPTTFEAKSSPLAKSVWTALTNDKGFGVPVYDPNGSVSAGALDVAKHLAKSETPWDTIVTAWDKLHGKTSTIENDKLVGNATGFTYSQGHPQGPEAGVAAEVEARIKAQKMMAMEEVKRLLKYDKEDQAREKLEAIGLSPREVTQIIKRIEQPSEGMTRSQRKRFGQHGTEEDQERMDRVTR